MSLNFIVDENISPDTDPLSDENLSAVVGIATSGRLTSVHFFKAIRDLAPPTEHFFLYVWVVMPTLHYQIWIHFNTPVQIQIGIKIYICKPNCIICISVVHMVNSMILFTLIWSDF